MTTTNGKGTTPTTYKTLAKAIHEADKSALTKWVDAFREYKSNGNGDKLAWAIAWEKALKGSKYDSNSAGTIRVNLSHIEWAEDNITGGANACKSLAHIIRQKSESKGKSSEPKDTASYKVRTISGSDLVRELVANGVERKTALIIAKNMRFM